MVDKHVKVTLKNGALDIADAGGLKFERAKGTRVVFWELVGAGLEEAFFPEDHPGAPAFSWIDSPGPGIFTPAKIFGAGRFLTIDNRHFNLGSKGTWIYMLRAATPRAGSPGQFDYYTTTTHPIPGKAGFRTINNPVIINK